MANPTLSEGDHPSSTDPGPVGALATAFTAVMAALAALVLVATLSGCASQVDGQWHDPSLGPAALRGARVLVNCEADEPVVQRLCIEQLAAAVSSRGGTAVLPPENLLSTSSATSQGEGAVLAAARDNQARAVIINRVAPTVTSVGSSSGVRLGFGGFGFGGGGVYSGVGVSMPVGGSPQTVNTHYAANTRLLDPGSGKLLWTAKASVSSTSSNDLQAQISELTHTVFAAMDKSSLF